MRLIFSLLAKLLYLLRLKGYLSPSQPLVTNYFPVNLSLRGIPSGCTLNISQCVWACVCSVFLFVCVLGFFFGGGEVVYLFSAVSEINCFGVFFGGGVVYLFSEVSEINPATASDGSPLQGAICTC